MMRQNFDLDWAGKWAMYQPDKTAFWNLAGAGGAVTYLEWHQRSNAVAAYLKDVHGLQRGDRVAVLSTFRDGFFYLFGAAQKLGIVLVPLNYRLNTRELAFLLENSGSRICVVEHAFLDLIPGAFEILNMDALEALTPEPTFKNVALQPEDAAFILYTSGTTGFPKGAIYTHQMMFWNSINTALRLKVHADDRTLMVMPPFHTGGWNVLTTPLLHFGATVYLLPKFEAHEVLHQLQQHRISLFMAVPTMVKMLADCGGFEAADFTALRYFIVGGEPLPIPMIEKWAEKGVPIRQGYGLTEAGPNITSLSERDAIRKRGSIGFVNFYVDYMLADASGNPVSPGGRGELWLRGQVVSPGYWQQPEATQKAFSGEWFRTGDILWEDEEGFLYVVDRIKNMYISGGENVYPAEVEKYLMTHPGIAEVAVIGVPDDKWGEVGCAFVVMQAGVSFDSDDLLEFARTGLARFKVPKSFVHMDALPKTDTGKIDRKNLKRP
jgi:fatty-acyl-CoA synthase